MNNTNNFYNNSIEIMSPAGSYESLMAAIQGGAGSIYFGAGNLNMRANSSNNFSLDDIKNIANICTNNNVKSYLTVNTIIYDDEVESVKRIINIAKESGVTAIIASDMSVISYGRSIGMEIHISTQLNVTNIDSVRYFAQFADVIVLARELTLEKVAYICSKIKEENICGPSGNLVKIEIFVHGALCMAVSGKCYLSLHEKNYSANRGACLQTCRRAYTVTDKDTGYELEIDNQFIMSPKDLCTIGFLDKIIEAGASVLKIEGRGRAPEYVKTVTECYHSAVSAYLNGTFNKSNTDLWTEKLRTVFNRDFWDGYYLGQTFGQWSNRYGSQAIRRKIQIGRVQKYYDKAKAVALKIESDRLSIGDTIIITGTTTGVLEFVVEEIRIEDKNCEFGIKGEIISIPLDSKVRPNDKLFKVIPASEAILQ
jgi:U32 family peptidase